MKVKMLRILFILGDEFLEQIVTNSVQETENVGFNLAQKLVPGDVVAFYGGLGAGKTAFVRGLSLGLEITDDVSSPTFALVHEYRGKIPLVHFDMYRVNSWDDLYSTGFFDYLESGAILAIEWSENIENALPDNAIKVKIEIGNNEVQRKIIIQIKKIKE
jgi:tRNA threonylcarbamoyladenosine biosynthesis protein TsaE